MPRISLHRCPYCNRKEEYLNLKPKGWVSNAKDALHME
jgi:hypothetical protein